VVFKKRERERKREKGSRLREGKKEKGETLEF